jgi:hypothetical protein
MMQAIAVAEHAAEDIIAESASEHTRHQNLKEIPSNPQRRQDHEWKQCPSGDPKAPRHIRHIGMPRDGAHRRIASEICGFHQRQPKQEHDKGRSHLLQVSFQDARVDQVEHDITDPPRQGDGCFGQAMPVVENRRVINALVNLLLQQYV